MPTNDKASIFDDDLLSAEDLPVYERPQPVSSKRKWVEDNFDKLRILIDKKRYPFYVVAEMSGNRISSSSLVKHYKAVKRQRNKAKREAAKSQEDESTDQEAVIPKIEISQSMRDQANKRKVAKEQAESLGLHEMGDAVLIPEPKDEI